MYIGDGGRVGWMVGRMDGISMDGGRWEGMCGRVDGRMDARIDEWIDEWMNG